MKFLWDIFYTVWSQRIPAPKLKAFLRCIAIGHGGSRSCKRPAEEPGENSPKKIGVERGEELPLEDEEDGGGEVTVKAVVNIHARRSQTALIPSGV